MIYFDIDGTLLDHKRAERAGVKSFFETQATDPDQSPEEFATAWQLASGRHFQRYLQGEISFQEQRRARMREVFWSDRALTDEEADQLFKNYLTHYQEHWALFPDVLDVLKTLSAFNLGIISNGDSQQQREKLDRTGIADLFSTVLISGDIGISKPDPRIFLAACRQTNLLPNQCCYIGDSLEYDVIPAAKTGFLGIWLNRQAETNPTSLPKVATLDEIVPLIESQFHQR